MKNLRHNEGSRSLSAQRIKVNKIGNVHAPLPCMVTAPGESLFIRGSEVRQICANTAGSWEKLIWLSLDSLITNEDTILRSVRWCSGDNYR